ncbi:MAG: ABC transporter ATP-binding protein [Deltaproteobacteria bacterium]|nr:MAG: ABC transporter ATP-binding protein [Deltaproteobacteria bacterium]
MKALLEVSDLSVAYGDVQVLFDVSLEVHEGEIVTLLGSNGAGKTTTLRAISGLRPARGGDIRYRGESLLAIPASKRAELGIALVPEGRELWPPLTVRENLELGAYSKGARPRSGQNIERIFGLFPRLEERHAQLAGSLSGGEQQMCAIGRAMMSDPKLLMLDEPSLGLAPILVDQMFSIIRTLHGTGITVLLVEQNLQKALEIAQRGYVIETGQVKLQGSSGELLGDPAIRQAYLGL